MIFLSFLGEKMNSMLSGANALDDRCLLLQSNYSDDALLLMARLELQNGCALSDSERHCISQLSADELTCLLMSPKPAGRSGSSQFIDSSVLRWIAVMQSQYRRRDVTGATRRLVCLWTLAMTTQFLIQGLRFPNALSRDMSVFSRTLYFSVGLPFVWRFHDLSIQDYALPHHISAISRLSSGEIFELLCQRYLFSVMAVVAFAGQCSRYSFDVNYCTLVDYMCHLFLMLHVTPSLVEEVVVLCDFENTEPEKSITFRSLSSLQRFLRGSLFFCYLSFCSTMIGDYRIVTGVKRQMPNQMWRYYDFLSQLVYLSSYHITSDELRYYFFPPSGLSASRSSITRMGVIRTLLDSADGRVWQSFLTCFDVMDT